MAKVVPTVHIQQDGIHGLHTDEAELLGQTKEMYKDYWKNKNDGQPISKELNGDYWKVKYWINRLDNGEPNINKQFWFKNKEGEEFRVAGHVMSEEGSLNWALERTKEIIEDVGFLASLYEDHQRYEGDVARLISKAQIIDVSLHKTDIVEGKAKGNMTREAIEKIHPECEATTKATIIDWEITSTNVENELVSNNELENAALNNLELPLAPTDSGSPRKETVGTSIAETITLASGKTIKFGGNEPGRVL